MSINKLSFSLEPLHEKGYTLHTSFLDEENRAVGSSRFTFTQKKSPLEGSILDVYSLNGTTSTKGVAHKLLLKHPEDEKAVRDACEAVQKLPASINRDHTIIVVDIKDHKEGYLPKVRGVITSWEKNLEKFLTYDSVEDQKTTKEAAPRHVRIYKLLHDDPESRIHFMIEEGSVKTYILEHGAFTEEQINFLNGRMGGRYFCQLTEFFMNGFKFGATVRSEDGFEFQAENYISPIGTTAVFSPHATSVVFYPETYKDIYGSGESIYYKAIGAGGFSVALGDEGRNITKATITREDL